MTIKRSDPQKGRSAAAERLFLAVIILLFVFILTACNQDSDEIEDEAVAEANRPVVMITEPLDGAFVLPEQTVEIFSNSVGQRGITRVELLINGSVVRIDENAQPTENTPFIVAQPWIPAAVGSYTIQVRATNTANISGESAVITVEVTTDLPPTATPTAIEAAAVETLTPSPTSLPSTTTATEPAPAVIDTATPTVESAPPTATLTAEPTPLPLPAATFEPTGLEPEGRFRAIWEELGGGDGALGYPTEPPIEDRDFARQYFESGIMIWWDNPDGDDPIWALGSADEAFLSGSAWGRYADTWEGDDEYSCDEAEENGSRGPVRGFGKVWCDHPDLIAGLGDPTEPEGGSGGNAPYSIVQYFQGGTMVYNPLNAEVYVLINDQGWRKFWY